MKRIDVLWLVEHVAREMDVACAVKALADAAGGPHIVIRNMYADASSSLRELEPRVVVHPFFFFCQGALATEDYATRWPDAVHFNLAWEELFYQAHATIKAPSDAFAKQSVVHHAWGGFYRDYLLHHGVPAANIRVNGQPAYQLYRAPYRAYYPSREDLAREHGLDPTRRWVFIPENYRWAFIGGKMHLFTKLGAKADDIARLREFSVESLSQLLAWCNTAASVGDCILVFRTRPSTSSETMQRFFAEHVGSPAPHLRFIKAGSVREWVLASDVVISSYSTTLIEAAVAGKAACMAEPIPIPPDLYYAWSEFVPHLRTSGEFAAACRGEVGAAGGDGRLLAWAEGELLGNGDPIAGLVRILQGLVRDSNRAPARLRRWRRVRRNAHLALPEKAYVNRASHELDDFTAQDVTARVERWRQVLNAGGGDHG